MGPKEMGLRNRTQSKPMGRNRHKEWQKTAFIWGTLVYNHKWEMDK
jgi:hypothetical protein